jgi:hypothetical protein
MAISLSEAASFTAPVVTGNSSSEVSNGTSYPSMFTKSLGLDDSQPEPAAAAAAAAAAAHNNAHNSNSSDDWIRTRPGHLSSWYDNRTSTLKVDADAKGPILDFVIAGFPKCGTTTLEANLGYYAPMPVADVCVKAHQAVYYAYNNWPQKYGEEKILRGTKCPAYIYNMKEFSRYLPRAKTIIGIRHPVLWFQSFWNMLAGNDRRYGTMSPYNKTKPCTKERKCDNGCLGSQLLCMYRAEFHVALASYGKTPLTDQERQYLAPSRYYGGANIPNDQVRNPIFLYEQTELKQEYVWKDLANYLGIPEVKHDRYVSSHGQNATPNRLDICLPEYDDFRKLMMPIAHEMSIWFCDYFIKVAEDPSRPDVVVSRPDRFCQLVRNYTKDPCGRLERREDTGTYELRSDLNADLQ